MPGLADHDPDAFVQAALDLDTPDALPDWQRRLLGGTVAEVVRQADYRRYIQFAVKPPLAAWLTRLARDHDENRTQFVRLAVAERASRLTGRPVDEIMADMVCTNIRFYGKPPPPVRPMPPRRDA